MRKVSIFMLTCSLVLAGCGGNAPVTQTVQPEDSKTTGPGLSRAIVFDNTDGDTLFALREDGYSDFKLHSSINGKENISKIADGMNTIALGAVFSDDPQLAYVALRKTVNGSSQDVIVLYDTKKDVVEREITNLSAQGISGTVYNSLHLEGDKLQFVAETKLGSSSELPAPNQLELVLSCKNSNDCGKVREIASGKDDAFQKMLTQKLNTEQNSLSGQAVTPAVQMYWPKGVSGHHYPDSTFHTGNDAYSLDINRGGGEDDNGEPVRAAAGGKVIEVILSTKIPDYGNRVRIQHSNGAVTLYAHLKAVNVSSGALIAGKDSVGTVGNTGLDLTQKNVASHLHFTVYSTSGAGVYIASPYYPIYARVGTATATCQNITTDMRDGREYFPC